MRHYVIPPLTIGLTWMLLSGRISLESFAIGVVIGLVLIVGIRPQRQPLNLRQIPDQLLALIQYALLLAWDIILSGLGVTRRVLSPSLPINPGIIAVETQDETHNPVIAALSADVITLTPGELAVEVEDDHILYIHCLDAEASAQTAADAQSRRLKLFKRILGRTS